MYTGSPCVSCHDDEDFTLISEVTHPYLKNPPLDRAKSATSGKRVNGTTGGRPQTAPSLEGSLINYDSGQDNKVSPRSHKELKSQRRQSNNGSNSGRRQVKQATGQAFRGRLELDVTESGSRMPLKPPVARHVVLNSRISKSPTAHPRPDIDIEAVRDNSPSRIDMQAKADESISDSLENKEDGEGPQTFFKSSRPPRAQHMADDPDNKQYAAMKKTARESLSEADKSALRLGRLVLSTILNQPEISKPDAISRFFVDTWLSKNGSSLAKADGLSVSLMTNLQRAFTEYDPGVDAGAMQAATCQKTVAAVACETLDTLIQAFGDSNPVLHDIREALLPLIFMHPPELQLSKQQLSEQALVEGFKLRGERYINMDTWCEDGAVVLQELRETESHLFSERQKSLEATEAVTAMGIQYAKLQHDSATAISRMNHACADLKKSESNQQKSLARLAEVAAQLEEEKEKLAAASDKLAKEQKSGKAASIALSVLTTKYEKVVKERQELRGAKIKLKNDIDVINNTVVSTQKSFEATRSCLEAARANAKDAAAMMAAQEETLLKRDEKDGVVIMSMKHFFISDSNSDELLPRKVYDMLLTKPDALSALDAWKDDLLRRIDHMEHKLKAAGEALNQTDDENLKKAQRVHLQEIKELHAAHVKQIAELKEQHRGAMRGLEVSLGQYRQDNMDLTLERNSLEAELQISGEQQAQAAATFALETEALKSRVSELDARGQSVQERLRAMEEDSMLQEVLGETRRANADLSSRVRSLAQSLDDANSELDREKATGSSGKEELDLLGAELLHANNLVSEKEDFIVGLEEQIELLRKPNAKELKLRADIEALRVTLTARDDEVAGVVARLNVSDRESQRWQQEYDGASLRHEDWLVAQRTMSIKMTDDASATERILQSTISSQGEELDRMCARGWEAEHQLMLGEDWAGRGLELIEVLKGAVAAGEERHAVSSERIGEQSAEIERLSQELSSVVEDKDMFQRQSLESAEELSELSAEMDKLKLQLDQQSARQSSGGVGGTPAGLLNPLHASALVSTDEKSCQTEAMSDESRTLSSSSAGSGRMSRPESKVISSGNQSTGKSAPSRQNNRSGDTHAPAPARGQNKPPPGSGNRAVVSRSLTTQAGSRPGSAAAAAAARRASTLGGGGRSRNPSVDERSVDSSHSLSNSVASQRVKQGSGDRRGSRGALSSANSASTAASIPTSAGEASTKKMPGSSPPATGKRASTDTTTSLTSTNSDPMAGAGAGAGAGAVRGPGSTAVSVTLPSTSQMTVMADEDLSDGDSDHTALTSPIVCSRSRVDSHDHSQMDDDLSSVQSGPGRSFSAASRGTSGSSKRAKRRDSRGASRQRSNVDPSNTNESEDDEEGDADIEDLNLDPTDIAATLGELDNDFDKLFDMSIAFQSSHNFFFDIIALREKRNLQRFSRYKVMTREAKGLVARLEAQISLLARSLLKTNDHVTAQDDLLQAMRAEIADNRWIFELKNTNNLQQCPLKDAITVGGLLLQEAELGDDLEALACCEAVVQDKGCAFGIVRLANGVQEWKKTYDEKLQALATAKPYDALIRREDGSVDTDLDVELFEDPSHQIDILKQINTQLRQDKSDVQKLLSDELQYLRDKLKSKDNDLTAARGSNQKLCSEVRNLTTTTAPLDSYKAVRRALEDAVEFMSQLATGNQSALGADPLPTGSRHVSLLKSRVHGADGGGHAAGRVNVYGNPGMLWRKIQKSKRRERAGLLHQAGQREPPSDLSLVQRRSAVTPGSAPGPAPTATAALPTSDERLIDELSVICNDLAEKVLFSAEPFSASSFQRSSSECAGGVEGGGESCELFDESVLSAGLEISPSLLDYSVALNKNVNHHVDEIRRLKQRKAQLLGESNGDPTVQAERYYAAQNIFNARVPDTISKWSQAFLEGSGSEVAQAVARGGSSGPGASLPLRHEIRLPSPRGSGSGSGSGAEGSGGELPIIERRQLSAAEADSRPPSLPKKPFLSSYTKTSSKESDVPLLTKKVMK